MCVCVCVSLCLSVCECAHVYERICCVHVCVGCSLINSKFFYCRFAKLAELFKKSACHTGHKIQYKYCSKYKCY